MKVLCARCRVGWIEGDRCRRCGNKLSRAEQEQERFARVLRSGLICLVSVLAGLFVIIRILSRALTLVCGLLTLDRLDQPFEPGLPDFLYQLIN